MNEDLWESFCARRILPSINWTKDLIRDSKERNPGAKYELLPWVSACVFDNVSFKKDHKADHTSEHQGMRFDMTNWASIGVPHMLEPRADFNDVFNDHRFPAFKQGFDKYSIIPLLHSHHPEVSANRIDRWQTAFRLIPSKTYFQRGSSYTPPCALHIHYQHPVYERMQASYVDVEAEAEVFRDHPAHKHSLFQFCGGDGLSILRFNWILARDPEKYLNTAPICIPIQGEKPHGSHHVLHMGWRPYHPLHVELIDELDMKNLKADFTVEKYNEYNFGITILIEIYAQYLLKLEASEPTAPRLEQMTAYFAAVACNVDLEWIAHFLALVIGNCRHVPHACTCMRMMYQQKARPANL